VTVDKVIAKILWLTFFGPPRTFVDKLLPEVFRPGLKFLGWAIGLCPPIFSRVGFPPVPAPLGDQTRQEILYCPMLLCLTCRPGDVCGHHWPISWTSASRSVQQLETERLLLPVLGCGTVCQLTLFRVTHFLISVENLKHVCLGSPLLGVFCFSFSLWTVQFFLSHVKKL